MLAGWGARPVAAFTSIDPLPCLKSIRRVGDPHDKVSVRNALAIRHVSVEYSFWAEQRHYRSRSR